MTHGILSFGAYLPAARLERADIGAALGAGRLRGTRSVASYDEDTTSMGVEAARVALQRAPAGAVPDVLYFATANPAYLDKTNATALHAALGLPAATAAYDLLGSVRSGVAAMRAGLDAATSGRTALVVVSDLRVGLPGSGDEMEGGDGAAAFLLGGGDQVVAECVAQASLTEEFLERHRLPGEAASHVWEERFGEHVYVPLGERVLRDLLDAGGITAASVDHLVIAGMHARAVRRVAAASGVPGERVVDDLSSSAGNTGAAHAWLLLAGALEAARESARIAVAVLADGADALLLRTTPAWAAAGPRLEVGPTVADQAAGTRPVAYATYLTWRGLLRREPPRRPDPARPAAPPSRRAEAWKFGFVCSRCRDCGTRNLPPQRVCVHCHAVDRMVPERLADVGGTVATHTVDRLAFSPSPPVVAAAVDFDGGGRFQCELTDVDPARLHIGMRVTMSFRRLYTADGVHNYFWKARPVADGASVEGR